MKTIDELVSDIKEYIRIEDPSFTDADIFLRAILKVLIPIIKEKNET